MVCRRYPHTVQWYVCTSLCVYNMCSCTIVHAKIKAPLGSTNPMYCTNAAVSAETSLYKLLWYKLIVPWLLKCVRLHHPRAYHVLPRVRYKSHTLQKPWYNLYVHTYTYVCMYLWCACILEHTPITSLSLFP